MTTEITEAFQDKILDALNESLGKLSEQLDEMEETSDVEFIQQDTLNVNDYE
jgi:uncharacterized coiled-coil protein SlyX